MKSLSIVFGAAVVLSACAAPKFDYIKEGASDHEKVNSMSECNYQIRLNKTPPEDAQALLKLCMQGKGFRLKQTN